MSNDNIPAGYSSAHDYARAQAAMGGTYGRGVGRAEVLPAPAPATYSGQPAPVSREYIAAEAERQRNERNAAWFDYDHNVTHGTSARLGPVVLADSDPAGYLKAHGFVAVNGAGEEVTPSPDQARGLVGRLLKAMAQQGSRTSPRQVTQGIVYRDGNRPPAQQLVQLRRAF